MLTSSHYNIPVFLLLLYNNTILIITQIFKNSKFDSKVYDLGLTHKPLKCCRGTMVDMQCR